MEREDQYVQLSQDVLNCCFLPTGVATSLQREFVLSWLLPPRGASKSCRRETSVGSGEKSLQPGLSSAQRKAQGRAGGWKHMYEARMTTGNLSAASHDGEGPSAGAASQQQLPRPGAGWEGWEPAAAAAAAGEAPDVEKSQMRKRMLTSDQPPSPDRDTLLSASAHK